MSIEAKKQKAVVSGCVDQQTRDILVKIAERKRRTVSSVVAEALEEYVAKRPRKEAA